MDSDTGEEDENAAYRLFTRRVFVVGGTFGGTSFNDRAIRRGKYVIVAARAHSISEFRG